MIEVACSFLRRPAALRRAATATRAPLGQWLAAAAMVAGACNAAVVRAEALDCAAYADPAQPSVEAIQAATRAARDHGYLWRASKDGHTSFLYGTIHVGRLEWMFPGPTVAQALGAADILALELDPLDPQIQARLAQGIAAMPHAALPQALRQRLRSAAAALCVPYETIADFAPEFQVVTLSALAGRPEKLEAQFGVDVGLAAMAHRSGKDILSLETPEGQLQTLQMHDAKEAVAFVDESLDELEPSRASALLARMARAWVASDFDELEQYAHWCRCLDSAISRTVMARLLDDRNPGLAETIDRTHRSGKRVFAAVGSLHLFGRNGLPALLEQRGYRVERVAFPAP